MKAWEVVFTRRDSVVTLRVEAESIEDARTQAYTRAGWLGLNAIHVSPPVEVPVRVVREARFR